MTSCCRLADYSLHRGYTQQECLEAGGEWFDECPTGETTTNNCFVKDIMTKSLGQTILALGGTYDQAKGFKEEVLAGSKVGAELLDRYYLHLDAVAHFATGNPELLGRMINTWLVVMPYSSTMLAISRGEDPGGMGDMRFPPVTLERIRNVAEELRTQSADAKFKRAIDYFEKEIEGYVGLTPAESLSRIHRRGKLPATKAKA